jgi:hypothetical protein
MKVALTLALSQRARESFAPQRVLDVIRLSYLALLGRGEGEGSPHTKFSKE